MKNAKNQEVRRASLDNTYDPASQSWNFMRPMVVSASKFGISSPRLMPIFRNCQISPASKEKRQLHQNQHGISNEYITPEIHGRVLRNNVTESKCKTWGKWTINTALLMVNKNSQIFNFVFDRRLLCAFALCIFVPLRLRFRLWFHLVSFRELYWL